jgi:putative flavoprotein involved in K+ transport
MQSTSTVVIGAGQAGLATSCALTAAGIDHVVLERGRVAERWRSERWHSLRLLTPNWMTRLPSWQYAGADPDGFMTSSELASYLERYAASFAAPVLRTAVRSVAYARGAFQVVTDSGTWRAQHVVVATGHCHRAAVPAGAAAVSPDVLQLDPLQYRGPRSVAPGGVLVVGASSSGVQIAAELNHAGRDVVLAAGRHTRLPRRYRGRDVMRWLDLLGNFDRTLDELPREVALREPSLQLVGGTRDLDLGVLHQDGVQVTGRLVSAEGHALRFADDLAATTDEADRRLRRVLARIDNVAPRSVTDDVPPVGLPDGVTALDLRARGIATIVWATGFRGAWPWLHLPVVSGGRIQQHRGRTVVPGLHTVGQRFQHRRGSGLLDGVRHDVADVVSDIAPCLDTLAAS